MNSILWFRGFDLRLRDQLALRAAASADRMLPVFFLDEPALSGRPHHSQFLLDSLAALADALEARGSGLVLLDGDPVEGLAELARQTGAEEIHALGAADPRGVELEARAREELGEGLQLHEGYLLHPAGSLRTGSGTPYAVFTPFARAFRDRAHVGRPTSVPRRLPAIGRTGGVSSRRLPTPDELGFARNDRILRGGEQAARERLRRFLEVAEDYPEHRDRMDLQGTSRLSADLKFGTLSPRQVWVAVGDALGRRKPAQVFHTELIWREFNASTLYDRPALLEEPFRPEWADFDWRDDEEGWRAWTQGRTGYPVVDASARQLLAEGFVHNRARMISASFLTKHLLVHYARGEAHYLHHLTDGDAAQNVAGWQWSAGCGCDAQPWFRIFNPVTQGRKFDPDGDYVRRWVPELAPLPARWIHEPWAAPEEVLRSAGLRLGTDYPRPVVDHRQARERFLERARRDLDRGR